VDGTAAKPDEIVVVNGGDERSDAIVEQYAARAACPVRLVKTVNKNLATSRNVGLALCAKELVAMTDDDGEVFPDWVSQIKRLHREHPEAGAIGGPVRGMHSDSLISRLADLVTFPGRAVPAYVRTLPGVNVSYKRCVLDQIGEQDVTLFRGEDVDFNWRVLQVGYKVYFDPAVQVHHNHRSTLRSFLNQHYMYGRAYVLVRRKWPEMYCVYPHGIRRWWDVAKGLNFFGAAFYEPLRAAVRLERWSDRIAALPLLLAQQLAWRGGMIRQHLVRS
jgi:GT2 family glycosyltransferase